MHSVRKQKTHPEPSVSPSQMDIMSEESAFPLATITVSQTITLNCRVPQFESEGQARGIADNYRLSSSPMTWYLNGQGPPHSEIVIYCVFIQISKVNALSLAFK